MKEYGVRDGMIEMCFETVTRTAGSSSLRSQGLEARPVLMIVCV